MDAFVREMQEILLKEREELLNKLKAEEEDFKSDTGATGDDADKASDADDFQSKEIFNAMDAKRLKTLEGALKRVSNGRYGYCLQCGKKIPETRLRAMPSAVLCIECKEKQEREMAM